MRRTSSRSCFFESNDVVVDLDGAERLEIEARPAPRAAMDDARDRGPVFGADHQHVAAMAIRHDLLLQIFRGVLAAEVRLQRAPQPRPLTPEAVANAPQLRRGIVDDLTGGIDLAEDVGDLVIEGGRPLRDRAEEWKRCARPADRPARGGDGRQEVGERDQMKWFERPAFDPDAGEDDLELGRRLDRDLTFGEKADGFAGRRQRRRDGPRVGGRLERGEMSLALRGLGETPDHLDNTVEFKGPAGRRRACD